MVRKSEKEHKKELLVAYELGYRDGYVEAKRLFNTENSEPPDAPSIQRSSLFLEQLRKLAKARDIDFD